MRSKRFLCSIAFNYFYAVFKISIIFFSIIYGGKNKLLEKKQFYPRKPGTFRRNLEVRNRVANTFVLFHLTKKS